MRSWLLLLACLTLAQCQNAFALPAPETIQTERFGTVSVFRPAAEVTGFILWFAGSPGTGPNANSAVGSAVASTPQSAPPAVPRRLAEFVSQGYAVALVAYDPYLAALRSDGDDCMQFGELTRLSQVIQNSLRLPQLSTPIIAGTSGGEVVAYLAAASDPDHFKGAILGDGCAAMSAVPDICDDDIPEQYESGAKHLTLARNSAYRTLTLLLPPSEGRACDGAGALPAIPLSEVVIPDGIRIFKPGLAGSGDQERSRSEFLSAVATAPVHEQQTVAEQFGLVEEPAESPMGKPLLIFLSGDGGWASIDKELAAVFEQLGMNVLGLSSLSFFWRERTPAELAHALESILEEYADKWESKAIYLGGFSLGADVLPSGFNNLPEKVRRRIKGILLLSPGKKISFEVHLTDWLNLPDDEGPEALPEAQKINLPIVCVYGSDDDSICPQLSGGKNSIMQLPGGHHFDGDYESLGKRVFSLLTGGK